MTSNIFEQLVFSEAPGDEPEPVETGPPDLPAEDLAGEAPTGDEPPEIPEVDDFGTGDPGDELLDDGSTDGEAPLEISEKISVVMNYQLYQRFLTLSNTVSNQLSTIRSNNDLIHSVSPKALAVIEPLGKLGDNIRLYLTNNFLDNNYSRNLLFYNKCLNLMKLLEDIFARELSRGKPDAR